MSRSVLRYTYQSLDAKNWKDNEFGFSAWGYMWHKLDDGTIVAAYDGHRIYEVRPDNTHYLVCNFKTHGNGATNRWSRFFKDTIKFSTQRVNYANGRKQVKISFRYSEPGKANTFSGSAISDRLFRIDENDGKLTLTPVLENKDVYVKDNVKYRAFNKQLRNLKAVLVAQVRTGVYDKDLDRPKYDYSARYGDTVSLQQELVQLLGVTTNYIGYGDILRHTKLLTHQWLETRSPTLLRPLALLALYGFTSMESDLRKSLARRIHNALLSVQKAYLREHCVKIETSNNSLTSLSNDVKDQNSELLPAAGLREVQVSREVEVC